MKPIYLSVLLLFLSLNGLRAQTGLDLNVQTNKRYYYPVDSQQAYRLMTATLKPEDTAYFLQKPLVRQMDDDSPDLPVGNYIKAYPANNLLQYEYIPVTPWYIYLLDNKKDLVVQLMDNAAHVPVRVQSVQLDGVPLSYDADMMAYVLPMKHKTGGLLSVHDKGLTFYYKVVNNNSGNTPPDFLTKLLYGTPLKYGVIARNYMTTFTQQLIISPFYYATALPVDGFWSLKKHYSMGTVRGLQQKARWMRNKAGNWFRKDAYAYQYSSYRYRDWYESYFYFSKPQYKPGDTVKFKVYVLNKKKQKWYDKPLRLSITGNYGKTIPLGLLKSAPKSGGYNYRFTIADSMDFHLNTTCYVMLETADSEKMSGQFYYANYELKKAVFKIEMPDGSTQVKGKPYRIKFTAKDENELPMADTRATVYLLPNNIAGSAKDHVYVPDTLWSHTMSITKGEEELLVPDSLFPDVNVSYRLAVAMQNSENERTNVDGYIEYRYEANQVKMELSGSDVSITTDKPLKEKVRVYAKDRFGLVMFDTLVATPCRFPVNHIAAQYFCESAGAVYTMSGNYTHDLVPVMQRAADSISFSLSNPRQLPLVYHIYQTNKEVKRGSEKDFPFSIKSDENSLYYLLLEYVWGGYAQTGTYTIPLAKHNINLEVKQPAVVTPGRESAISITATDYKGKPVKDLNLLAYSYTNKFETGPLNPLPGVGSRYKPRTANNAFIIVNFNGGDFNYNYNREKSMALNYPFWNSKLHLDTSWAYRFRYPVKDTIIYTAIANEDNTTQVAPFIMEDGVQQPVYYVMIDYTPVYFGFTNIKLPYSFKTDGNYHELKIRTKDKLITIPSVLAAPGLKTIFSIDQGKATKYKYSLTPMPDTLTTDERSNLSRYVLKLRMPHYRLQYAYLERAMDPVQYIDLSKNGGFYNADYEYRYDEGYSNNRETRMAEGTIGPVVGRYWKYNAINQFEILFDFDGKSVYNFNTGYVKQQQGTADELIPPYSLYTLPSLNEVACNKQPIIDHYEEQFKQPGINLDLSYFSNQTTGKARLVTEYGKDVLEGPTVYIALSRTDSNGIFNIYRTGLLSSVSMPAGYYQLLFVMKEGLYYATDTFEVKENGATFYRIAKVQPVKDHRTAIIDSLYKEAKINAAKYIKINPALKPNAYDPAFYNEVPGKYWGIVVDSLDNPVSGARIQFQGTNIATRTDQDGRFRIEFPIRSTEQLIISGYGFPEQAEEPGRDMKIVFPHKKERYNYQDGGGDYMPMRAYASTASTATVLAENIVSSPYTMSLPSFDKIQNVTFDNNGIASKTNTGIALQGNGKSNGATTPLYVIDGVIYTGDAAMLDPSFIDAVSVLYDAEATSIYGSRGANGVVIITTRPGAVLPDIIKNGLVKPEMPMDDNMMVSGLRSNFRDDAYWQPELITDKYGKVTFGAKFPDDITNWKTMVLATDKQRRTGFALGNIKSYKPVTASLYLPRFMVVGDTAAFIGKALNYIGDTIAVTTSFFREDTLQSEEKAKLGAFKVDTLGVSATARDSMKLKYMLTKEDGYFDGEERTIPVFRKGVRMAEGGFQTLDMKDTSFTIMPDKDGDTMHLYATASVIDLLLDEIKVVRDYGYLCNEQMASKILAMVTKQRIYAAYHRPFSREDKQYTQSLIDKLVKNQNSSYMWGWWGTGSSINWISGHVLNSLNEAKKWAYYVPLDFSPLANALVNNLTMNNRRISLPELKMLADLDMEVDYEKYIGEIEQQKRTSLNTAFELIQLRQKVHLPYHADELMSLMETDVFGDIHWKDTARYVYNNELLTTLNALKVLQGDTAIHINKHKIINWLLKQRGSQGWRNTYESALVIETIGQILPLYDTSKLRPVMQFAGGIQEKIESFPYKQTAVVTEPIQVHKTGLSPVYFTWYAYKWDTTAGNAGNNFKIRSWFESQGDTTTYLSAGASVNLKVNVIVARSAEYVMIEIPIPAGCSYENMQQASYSNYEIHREYFDNKVSIFCQNLPEGNYTYNVALLPRYRGHYTLNPAKAELMYFPVFNGREKIKRVDIR